VTAARLGGSLASQATVKITAKSWRHENILCRPRAGGCLLPRCTDFSLVFLSSVRRAARQKFRLLFRTEYSALLFLRLPSVAGARTGVDPHDCRHNRFSNWFRVPLPLLHLPPPLGAALQGVATGVTGSVRRARGEGRPGLSASFRIDGCERMCPHAEPKIAALGGVRGSAALSKI